jgi:hypothetical protein
VPQRQCVAAYVHRRRVRRWHDRRNGAVPRVGDHSTTIRRLDRQPRHTTPTIQKTHRANGCAHGQSHPSTQPIRHAPRKRTGCSLHPAPNPPPALPHRQSTHLMRQPHTPPTHTLIRTAPHPRRERGDRIRNPPELALASTPPAAPCQHRAPLRSQSTHTPRSTCSQPCGATTHDLPRRISMRNPKPSSSRAGRRLLRPAKGWRSTEQGARPGGTGSASIGGNPTGFDPG